MARIVSLLGVSYSIPEPGDVNYDLALTNYLVALTTAFPQLNGGTYSLTGELDFGAAYGLKSVYYKSRTTNPASAGAVRLARADTLSWRNQANSADLALAVDSSNNLTFNSAYLTGNPYALVSTAAGPSIAAGATESIVVFNAIDTDTDNGFNVGTGQYTVPSGKSGHYLVQAQIAYNTAPTGTCTLSIYRTGVVQKTTQFIAPAAQQTIGITAVLFLANGVTIDIRTKHGNAGAQSLQTSGAVNFLSIKRITT